jgi:hypothetical protein
MRTSRNALWMARWYWASAWRSRAFAASAWALMRPPLQIGCAIAPATRAIPAVPENRSLSWSQETVGVGESARVNAAAAQDAAAFSTIR